MNEIHLEKIDLNLLVVLREIHAEGSVTRAAANLNVSQSAISHALRRLRETLNDALFIRQGAVLRPTPLMKNLAGPLHTTLRALEDVLNTATTFNAATSTRRFTVGMDERLEVFALPPFVERLVTNAPGIEFRSVRLSPHDVEHHLSNGTMDMAVTTATLRSVQLKRVRVAEDNLAVLARRDHPVVRDGKLSLQQYLAAQHIAVTANPAFPTDEDVALAAAGYGRAVRVYTQRYVAAITTVSRSDLLLTMPRLYTEVVNYAARNQVLAFPIPIPKVEYFLYWHPVSAGDAGNAWLREEMTRSFSSQMARTFDAGDRPV